MSPKKSGVTVGVRAALLSLAVSWVPLAEAAGIQYSLTSLGSNAWRYDYTLNNAGPSVAFDEFTIYFDLPGVLSIDSFVVPIGWDPLTIQPDSGIPASGFVDALRAAGPVPAGSFSGFSAEFHYAAGLTPASQLFQLILSPSFDVVVSGTTTAIPVVTPVPEPESYALMLSGLAAVGWAARRRKGDALGNERGSVAVIEGERA